MYTLHGKCILWRLKIRCILQAQVLSKKKLQFQGNKQQRDGSLGILTTLDSPEFPSRQQPEIYHSSKAFRTAVGPTHRLQWAPESLSPGWSRPRREGDHSPDPVPRLRISGDIPPLPLTPSWRARGQLYLVWCTHIHYARNASSARHRNNPFRHSAKIHL